MKKRRTICVALLGLACAVVGLVLVLYDYVRADVLGGPLPAPSLPCDIIQLTPVEKLGKLMRGVLDLAKGALGSGEEVLQILVNVANTPEMIRGIRNLMILAKVVNSFEPELLEGLEQAVQEGLAEARRPKPVGLWQLMKKLLGQESRRVLIATANMLQAVGKSLGK
jgi:uncharacterized protein YjgD (DUF1641 family)